MENIYEAIDCALPNRYKKKINTNNLEERDSEKEKVEE